MGIRISTFLSVPLSPVIKLPGINNDFLNQNGIERNEWHGKKSGSPRFEFHALCLTHEVVGLRRFGEHYRPEDDSITRQYSRFAN